MKRKIGYAVGFVISVFCLYLVFKDVRWSDFARAVGTFEWIWLLPAAFFFYWSMYLRAARWAYFFRPRYEIKGARMFRPIMICFAFNGIFPARVGEVVRAFYVGKHERTGMPTALGTIVAERIFDAVTLLAMLVVSLAMLPEIDPGLEKSFWGYTVSGEQLASGMSRLIKGCIVLVVGVIVFMIPAVQRLAMRIASRLPLLPEGIKGHLVKFIGEVAQGLDALRSPKNLVMILWHSFWIWWMVAISNWLLAFGFEALDIDLTQATALVCLIAVFILIPAAPGYWGLFEAGVLFTLIALDISDDESVATAYAIVMHLLQYVPIVVVGLIFAAQSRVGLEAVRKAEEEAHEALESG